LKNIVDRMESLDTMGHLTAAADRGRTVQSHYPNEAQPSYGIAKDYYQTFLMTNVEPQFISSGSTDPWTEFEDYLRENLVGTFNNNTNSFGGQGRELYIIAGRDGENGTINSPNGYQLIVPSHLWKVVLVMDRPGQNIADITQNTTAFAVFQITVQFPVEIGENISSQSMT
jgi:DNA/RNA endonuclease G (NUC1)